MARINTYSKDTTVQKNDKLLGSNADGTTRNFSIEDISKFQANTNAGAVIGQLPYVYHNSSFGGNLARQSGSITIDTLDASTAFSSVTTIKVSKFPYGYENDAVAVINAFLNKEIIIASQDTPNNFGIFTCTAVTQDSVETDFYDLTLTYNSGNGDLVNKDFYSAARYIGSDLNTTYDLSVPSATTSIRLAGSDSTNDDVTITGSGTTTVTRTSGTELTISSADQYTGTVTGTGTTNYLSKFTGSSAIGDSVVFDNGTNVGIGTTSPSEKLHVDGNARVTGAIYDSNNEPGTSGQLLSSTATGTDWIDQGSITASNAEHVVVYAKNTHTASIAKGTPVYITGTVGATDTVEIAPADASNSAKMPAVGILDSTLAVNDFGYVITGGFMDNITTDPIDGATPNSNDTVYVKAGGGLTLTKPTGSTNLIQNIAKVGKVSGGNAGSLIVSSILRTNDIPNLTTGKIWVGDSNTIESATVHLDEANTRLGVGTTTPSVTLDVNGAGRFSGFIRSNFLNNYANSKTIIGAPSNYVSIYDGSGVEAVRVDSSGNVGIGTTSPSQTLSVEGNIELGTGGYIYGDTTNPYVRLSNTHGADLAYGATNKVSVGGPITITSSAVDVARFRSNKVIFTQPLFVGTSNINDTPTAELQVQGAGSTSSTSALLVQNSATTELFRVRDDGSVYALGSGAIATNTAFGKEAFKSNTTGSLNVAIGAEALELNTTGQENTAVGFQAMENNLTGSDNTALGFKALENNTANENTAIGHESLQDNTTGTFNTAVGSKSLQNNTASFNTAFGAYTLNANTTGTNNVAVGINSLRLNVSGSTNTAIGRESLYSNTASSSTAVGYQALFNNTTGASNVAVGYQAMLDATTGGFNVAVGELALSSNTTATNSVAIGRRALQNANVNQLVAVGSYAGSAHTTGGYATYLGYGAGGATTTGAENTAVGSGALNLNVTGNNNTAVGKEALRSNTASNNIAIGSTALYSNTSGASHVAIGFQASFNNTTASDNVSIGYRALFTNSTGTRNVAVGKEALRQNTGSYNTAVGMNALYLNTASNVVAIGYEAMERNTTGSSNTAVGYRSLKFNTTSNNNTALGHIALEDSTGSSNTAVGSEALQQNTTASNNTAVGYRALQTNTTGASNTAVGNFSLNTNQTGTRNNAFGVGALRTMNGGTGNAGFGNETFRSTTTGSNNIGMGDYAGYYNTTGSNNIALGYRSNFVNTTGNNNVAIGHQALYDNTASDNTAIGAQSLFDNTTATANTAVGREAGYNVTTGGNNVFLGKAAGRGQTTGQLNIAIGPLSMYSSGALGNSNIALGYYNQFSHTNASQNISIGVQAMQYNTTGSDNVVIGHAAAQGTSGVSVGSSNTVIGRSALTGGFNSSVVLGRAAAATASNQFVVGSSSYNAGAVTTETITADKTWTVKINGTDYKIPIVAA